MGVSNSRASNDTDNDRATTIIIEESDAPQSLTEEVPATLQLRTDGDKLVYRARELEAEAALLRTRGEAEDELRACQLDEESQNKLAEAKVKYREYIEQSGCSRPEDREAILRLVGQACALVNGADDLLKKKRKRPGDFFKARDMYREARDKYWLVKRDLHAYRTRVRECLLRGDEAEQRGDEDRLEQQEQEQEQSPKFVELMQRLDDLETKLNRNITAIDYFKEALMKPIIFTVVIVLILIMVLITYFCV